MEQLFKSDFLDMNYDHGRDIFMGKWNNCDSAEKLISGIKDYKNLFESIVPRKIIWDMTSMSYRIPPDLQNWILDFLDIPACKHPVDYKVAHILSPDIYAALSVMNMYTDGKTTFTPHYFNNDKLALQWVTADKISVPDPGIAAPQLKVEQYIGQNMGRITLEVDMDELPDYLNQFLRAIKNRKFLSEGISYFMELTTKEKLILTLIIQGKSNKEIADLYSISCETVKTHRRNLIRKLKCKNLTDLLRYQVFL